MGALRKLFGPSKQEVWRQLCAETGATYVQGGFWKGDKVQVTHDSWTVTLDTYAVSTGKSTIVFTRLKAPFANPDHFRFTIYREGLFSDIAKWFGMQDIEVGHEEFDRDFIIKGTQETKVRALFDNPRIRELIAAQPNIHLMVKGAGESWGASSATTTDTDKLYFHVPGIIKDVERLKLLFDLFAEMLDQLYRIGSADQGEPKPKP